MSKEFTSLIASYKNSKMKRVSAIYADTCHAFWHLVDKDLKINNPSSYRNYE